MFDGIISLLVMPIYIGGLVFIFIFNVLCKIFAFTEHELSYDNFSFFIDYHKYSIAILVIFFILVFFG